jgi:enamine deaminase RidA (YjgF/YER057c/UK114 family)
VSITEVLGTEDEDILTQEVFSFVQTAFRDGKVEGDLRPTGIRPTFMNAFKVRGISLPPGDFGIPPEDPNQPAARVGKSRWGSGLAPRPVEEATMLVGLGRAIVAGGMVYVSAVGPVDPESGRVMSGEIRAQARQCLQNLRARLEENGSSLDKVVWANWSLRDATEFDAFYGEWLRCFPGDAPVGQETLLPLAHRRAGFRVSIGVIASQ